MEQDIKNEEVLANSSSQIVYKGTVKIDVIRGNKVIKSYNNHNQGNVSLFSFITWCLTGEFKDSLRPKFLRGYSKENDDYTLMTTTPIHYRSCEKIGSSKAVYKFLIPANSIIPQVVDSPKNLNHFRLFSQDNRDMLLDINACCAFIDLKTGDIVPDNKTNFLITWTLEITNNGGN